MEKVVDITAKRDGFRRAGMKHSDVTQTYPLSQFTKEQLKQLQDEPMLVVAIRDKDAAGAADIVTDLRQQIATLEADCLALVTQNQQALSDLDAANRLLSDERQKNSELATELNSERQMVTQLNADLDTERQAVADLTTKLAAAEKAAKKEK